MKYIEEFKKDEEQQGYFYAKDELLNKLYGFEDRGEFTIEVLDEMFDLQTRIDKAIEYITDGSDFKSIYFKKTDEELWKILLEDNIKNNLLDILRGKDNE